MPVELTASTRRSTYFAGESITVEINISNIFQMVNRYFAQNPSNNPSAPNTNNVSPYGSINGVPSIGQMNQMKGNPSGSRSACMTPNNSSMNLLADYTDQMSIGGIPNNVNDFSSVQGSFQGHIKDDKSIGSVGTLKDSHSTKSHSRHSKSRNHPSLYQNPRSQHNLINTLATNCSNNDASERVAWVSVYMHCECNVNRNKVALQNISAALAPVKSVFSHDFEGTNTDIQSHLFDEPANPHDPSQPGGPLPKSNVNLKSSHGDTDSGVGGISSAASGSAAAVCTSCTRRWAYPTQRRPACPEVSTGACVCGPD